MKPSIESIYREVLQKVANGEMSVDDMLSVLSSHLDAKDREIQELNNQILCLKIEKTLGHKVTIINK